jgi:hypothetical protein
MTTGGSVGRHAPRHRRQEPDPAPHALPTSVRIVLLAVLAGAAAALLSWAVTSIW